MDVCCHVLSSQGLSCQTQQFQWEGLLVPMCLGGLALQRGYAPCSSLHGPLFLWCYELQCLQLDKLFTPSAFTCISKDLTWQSGSEVHGTVAVLWLMRWTWANAVQWTGLPARRTQLFCWWLCIC